MHSLCWRLSCDRAHTDFLFFFFLMHRYPISAHRSSSYFLLIRVCHWLQMRSATLFIETFENQQRPLNGNIRFVKNLFPLLAIFFQFSTCTKCQFFFIFNVCKNLDRVVRYPAAICVGKKRTFGIAVVPAMRITINRRCFSLNEFSKSDPVLLVANVVEKIVQAKTSRIEEWQQLHRER